MDAIKIRRESIDFEKIISLVFDRKEWGKIYTMYTAGSTTITCMLKEFNFETSTAWFKIKVTFYDEDSHIYTKTNDYVRYVINHFSKEDFEMHLKKKIRSLLNDALESTTKQLAETKHSDLKYYNFQIKEKEITKSGYGGDLQKIQDLENDDLIEKCFEELKEVVAEKLNEPYEEELAKEMRTNPFVNTGIRMILDELK